MGASFSYLTVLSVQQLKALDVLQLDSLRQRLPLQVDVWELWEGSGCIWNKRALDTQREITSEQYIILSYMSLLYFQPVYLLVHSPRNCWYCWTWVLMSTWPAPCCCCCCWPAAAAAPLVIPSTLCTGFNLIGTNIKLIGWGRSNILIYTKKMNTKARLRQRKNKCTKEIDSCVQIIDGRKWLQWWNNNRKMPKYGRLKLVWFQKQSGCLWENDPTSAWFIT